MDESRIDPAALRGARFPGSSRKYDARAVDRFLHDLADKVADTNAQLDELRREVEVVRRPTEEAVAPKIGALSGLDDEALVALVGEETASVLVTARRAAEEIRTKAEESAARLIRESTAEAKRVEEEARTAADALRAEATALRDRAAEDAATEVARLRAEADAELADRRATADAAIEAERAAAAAARESAETERERVLEEAREEGRGMVAEAREVRSRVLDDLQRRRDAARAQIERLLAGRDRLLEAYDAVQANLDEVTAQLRDALAEPVEVPPLDLPDGFAGVVRGDAAAAVGATAPVEVPEPAATAPVDGEPEEDGREDDDPEDDVADVEGTSSDAVEDAPRPLGPVAGAPDDTEVPEAVALTVAPEPDADADVAAEPISGDAPGPDAAADAEPADDQPTAARVADEPVEDEVAEDDSARADDGASSTEGGARPEVDALFARLRAEREQSVAHARDVLVEAPTDETGAPDEAASLVEAGAADEAEASDEAASLVDAPTGVAPTEGGEQWSSELLAPAGPLASRAEALAPLEAALVRSLKRHLADEQNQVLDLLRRTGAVTLDGLLPTEHDHLRGYAEVASSALAGAADAGAVAVGGPPQGGDAVVDLAENLAGVIVEPFRRRVQRSVEEVGGDPDELDDRLRALYREWKVQNLAPAASDALLGAYALGSRLGAAEGTLVRWTVDPTQGPCPDAEDNALAGSAPIGEPFPTGDICPQAHPGCRCLLVLADA